VLSGFWFCGLLRPIRLAAALADYLAYLPPDIIGCEAEVWKQIRCLA
jgi:hypothetical protein